MFAGLPSLSHEQQQKAVERIHELMAQGISSGQAIAPGGGRAGAQRIPASRSSRALKMRMRTSNYTAAIILILNFILRVHQRRFHRAARTGA